MQDAKGRTLKIDIRSLGLDKPVSARLPRPGAPSFAKEAGFDYRFIFETLYDAVLITDAKASSRASTAARSSSSATRRTARSRASRSSSSWAA